MYAHISIYLYIYIYSMGIWLQFHQIIISDKTRKRDLFLIKYCQSGEIHAIA